MRAWFLFLTIILSLSSCSSAPKQKEEITDAKNRAAEYAESGNAYYQQAQYDKALSFFDLALTYNVSVDNEPGIVQSYASIGKVYVATGDMKTAQWYFSQAKEIAEKIRDNTLLFQSSNNLGEWYMLQGDYNKAEEFFQEAGLALETIEKGSDKKDPARIEADKAILYHNLGVLRKYTGDMTAAEKLFEQAATINRKLKRHKELASNYYNLASLFSKQEDYPKAIEYANLALTHDKLWEHSLGIAMDLFALGIIHAKAGNHGEAYAYFKKALRVYTVLNLSNDVLKTLKQLEETAERLGKPEEAEEYRNLSMNMESKGKEARP